MNLLILTLIKVKELKNNNVKLEEEGDCPLNMVGVPRTVIGAWFRTSGREFPSPLVQ